MMEVLGWQLGRQSQISTKAAMTQQAIQKQLSEKGPTTKKEAGPEVKISGADHDDLKKKVLHRVEFLICLINIAIFRWRGSRFVHMTGLWHSSGMLHFWYIVGPRL